MLNPKITRKGIDEEMAVVHYRCVVVNSTRTGRGWISAYGYAWGSRL